MGLLKICLLGDPILRRKAEPVPKVSEKIKSLLADMAETMYAAPGVGLAAPQVGVVKRIIVVDAGEGLLELVNPRLVGHWGSETATEGCLSVPGLAGDVTRAARVLVQALDRKGHRVEIDADGLLARVLQHELDHLDGILFVDKAQNLRQVEAGVQDETEREGG